METTKIIALLSYLGLSIVSDIHIEDDKEINIENETYIVLADDEADDAFRDYQENVFDDLGLDGYTENFKEWIICNALDSDRFDEIQREFYEGYIADIKCEGGNGDYETRLDEEMADANCETEEEFLDYLTEDDSIEWFRNDYGESSLSDYIKQYPEVIDFDKVVEELQSWDGRGNSLASYDGEELELDNGYFAYRID